ncbi:TSPAN18 [Mytilus coruscus]|uniref:Tetraspanin n=1 Tax=Mytilus coruscus TaxID=42192 RepID=A0A6J8E556_MYTCO|nr:TSPAN18 [Mytilus coruscus]
MAIGCGASIVKIILFVVNFIFFFLGILAVALGITAIVKNSALEVLTQFGDAENYDVTSLLRTGAVVLIVGGVFALIVGFLGCCGAWKMHKLMLQIYAGIIIIILIIELTAAIIAIVFTSDVTSKLKPILLERINASYDGKLNTGDAFTLGVNFAQVKFDCCGVNNYTDFDGATKWNKTLSDGGTARIPVTCCKITNKDSFYDNPSSAAFDKNCQKTPTNVNSNWEKSCYSSIYDYAKDNAALVIGVGITIVIVQVLCIFFACCLIRAMKDQLQ